VKDGAWTTEVDAIFASMLASRRSSGSITFRLAHHGRQRFACDHRACRQTHGRCRGGSIHRRRSQIVLGLQTIVSASWTSRPRRPSLPSVPSRRQPVQHRADEVRMTGPSDFDPEMQKQIHARVKRTAESVAPQPRTAT